MTVARSLAVGRTMDMMQSVADETGRGALEIRRELRIVRISAKPMRKAEKAYVWWCLTAAVTQTAD